MESPQAHGEVLEGVVEGVGWGGVGVHSVITEDEAMRQPPCSDLYLRNYLISSSVSIKIIYLQYFTPWWTKQNRGLRWSLNFVLKNKSLPPVV